jgi:excisionase family DNA binding protein
LATITPFDNYLDLVEAARELAIHPQSLRRLIKQKKIPATLFAGKYLIERDTKAHPAPVVGRAG